MDRSRHSRCRLLPAGVALYNLLTSFADALWTRAGRTAGVWVWSGIKLMQGGIQPILSGRVFVPTAEGADSVQSARSLPMVLRLVGAGRHRGSTPLPPRLPPGVCIVQLTITDPPAGQHRIVRLRLEVVGPPGR